MAFADFPEQQEVTRLLQRSLEQDRLAHAYLFSGSDLVVLEAMARNLAKILNCEAPPRRSPRGLALDCCDHCASCRKVDGSNHADVTWVRPESKLRIITIDQMRDLMRTVQLKPASSQWKTGIIVGADRLNIQAANAFLKTLEETPGASVLILLTTEPQRVLETILSRCLRLNFAGSPASATDPAFLEWLGRFAEVASQEHKSLLSRYRLLSTLLDRLNVTKSEITEQLTTASPLNRYEDPDPKQREQWEDELAAGIEAEYRRRRAELLAGLQWWFRDVWLHSLNLGEVPLVYGQFAASSSRIGSRLSAEQAQENLRLLEHAQRLLNTNVQEALALEVSLLTLKL